MLFEALGLAIILGRGYPDKTPEDLLSILPPIELLYEPESYIIYERNFFPVSCLMPNVTTQCLAVARTAPWRDLQGRCIIHMNPHLSGWSYWFILWHEFGHCNDSKEHYGTHWYGHPDMGTSNVTVEFVIDLIENMRGSSQ